MTKVGRYTRTFIFIGILGSIIGYLFLLYRVYTLDEEISDKKSTLKKLDEKISSLKKKKDEIENKLQHLDLKYSYGLSIENSLDLPENLKIISKSDSANSLIETIQSNHTVDTNVIVNYYSKTSESENITLSLKSLSYNLRTENPSNQMRDLQTSCVWFGKKVDIADVKVVALALIRAGIPIKSIRPFGNNSINYKPNVIEIGADVKVVNSSIEPYSVYQIDTITEFTRNIAGYSR